MTELSHTTADNEKVANPFWRVSRSGGTTTLTLSGDWVQANAANLPDTDQVIEALVGQDSVITVDVQAVERWDSMLTALLFGLRRRTEVQKASLDLTSLPDDVTAMLELTEASKVSPLEQSAPYNMFEEVGKATLRQWFNLLTIGNSVFYFMRSTLHAVTGRGQFRRQDIFAALEHSTINALPIVTIVSILMGSILAFVGSIQLRAFGAEIFIADTVGIATFREMAALLTAIVLAGHTGAAFAASLATMQVNEEVDALRTLGLSPYEYLAVPRVIALALALPMLYIYATVITLFGSMLVANLTLDLSPLAYAARTVESVPLYYITVGLIKSLCFGVLIGLVSCHIGLHSGRSAEAVGLAATRAVVVSIIGIIAVDSLFAIASIIFGI